MGEKMSPHYPLAPRSLAPFLCLDRRRQRGIDLERR